MKLLSRSALFAYGLFGLPLALVALPIYVLVPQLYAQQFGLSLTVIGLTLLVARIMDAFIDLPIGLWVDKKNTPLGHAYFILLSLPFLLIGFITLFHPQVSEPTPLAIWFFLSLALVYVGFSFASIAHNSWGASLTWQRGERARLTAVREACALLGVILAAAVPAVFGLAWLSVLFSISLLLCAFILLRYAPKGRHTVSNTQAESVFAPLQNRQFLSLLSVFATNGIAAAIPASLFLFFVSDRLQLATYAGLFLVLYFLAAACALPLWIKLAREFGEARSWLVAMALAVVSFIWAANLAPGSLLGFVFVCIASGVALGADLALPPALLAAVIGEAGHDGHREGTYFGIWSWTTKMNLALAAGISLPLLDYLGYSPGITTPSSSSALVIAYVWLPCLLKCIAMILLWRAPLKDL